VKLLDLFHNSYSTDIKVINGSEIDQFLNNSQVLQTFFNTQIQQLTKYQPELGSRYNAMYRQSKRILINTEEKPTQKEPINIYGISTEFSNLKKESDIVSFSDKYGLLGCTNSNTFVGSFYSYTIIEPLTVWRSHINHVRRLLALYRMLKKKKRGEHVDILGDLIECHDNNDHFFTFTWKNYSTDKDKSINLQPIFMEPSDTFDEDIGVLIFTEAIKNALSDGVEISYSDIRRSDKSDIGFFIKPTLSTDYLLAAIYYDLLRLFNENKQIEHCLYCNNPFKKFGRKKYCSDTCKVKHHLANKK
jgi:hypothetical protein